MTFRILSLVLAAVLLRVAIFAANPIIPNRGVCDPHILIFNNRAYLYATHDRSRDSRQFLMDDWWVWSSDDLAEWKLESVLKPEQTYLRRPFEQCWATDAAERNGKYFFYFSAGSEQTGVVVGDTPIGPWRDPLGKPLLASELTPTHEYDISVFTDSDGVAYVVFGVWDYYIARLGEDMISLAEPPRRIEIAGAVGPYGPGRTDDKSFLHRRGDLYYLSWGVFYATAPSPYGPYTYRGAIMDDRSFHQGTIAPTWPHGFRQGRHGSFFEWHNQWYFAYCDISQTDNRFFRDSFISYVHFRANGEMAPIRVDRVGVGQYEPALGPVEAEDYFATEGCEKVELPLGGFGVVPRNPGATLSYPKVAGLAQQRSLTITFMGNSRDAKPVVVEVAMDLKAPALASLTLPAVPFQQTASARIDLALPENAKDLVLRVPAGSRDVVIDSLTLSTKPTSQLSPHRLFRLP